MRAVRSRPRRAKLHEQENCDRQGSHCRHYPWPSSRRLARDDVRHHRGAGIVEFYHRAYNQDGKLVAECHRQAFMRMRPR